MQVINPELSGKAIADRNSFAYKYRSQNSPLSSHKVFRVFLAPNPSILVMDGPLDPTRAIEIQIR